jgi:hypothetical protein
MTMDDWIDVTTLHDPERVFVNQRTGERRTEPFDPPSAEVQRRVDELLREIEAKEPADPEKAGG